MADAGAGGSGGGGAPAAQQITLIVKSQDGTEMQFKVKPTTKFGKMIAAYCSSKGLSQGHVKFLFDGDRLNEQATPAELDMQSDDVIDAVTEQTGGGAHATSCSSSWPHV